MAAEPAPACIETHISWVLLTGDRALKFPKPVTTPFLDQGTVELRRTACEREVALNSRLAPDVYLGVGEVVVDGDAVEPLVVMRRMPDDRRLSTLLAAPEAEERVREVAKAVAGFHSRAEVLAQDDAEAVSGVDALRRRWEEDLAETRDAAGAEVAPRIDAIAVRALDYIDGRAALFERRIADGMVRDGHGDLLADDIFCLDDGPRILDCLAFADRLRWNDVLADVAFLIMDLQSDGHGELGRSFLHGYCEYSGEHHPGSLAHLYVAQRALVRAKVGALRHRQEGAETVGTDVDHLLGLVEDHLERATIRLVLVGGLPGSGKSTLAGQLGDELGWAVLSSDEIRRDLGLRYADLHDESAYSADTVGRVYDEMRRRAAQLMASGVSVVLDATWTAGDERELARATAAGARAEVVELRCDAPPDLCRARIAGRTSTSGSEATPRVVDVLGSRADPWPEATAVDTSDGPREPATTRVHAVWWRATAPT